MNLYIFFYLFCPLLSAWLLILYRELIGRHLLLPMPPPPEMRHNCLNGLTIFQDWNWFIGLWDSLSTQLLGMKLLWEVSYGRVTGFRICCPQIWHLGIVFQAEEICEMAHEGKSLFFLFACLFDSLLLSKQVNWNPQCPTEAVRINTHLFWWFLSSSGRTS